MKLKSSPANTPRYCILKSRDHYALEREVEELGDGKLYTKPSTGRLLVA